LFVLVGLAQPALGQYPSPYFARPYQAQPYCPQLVFPPTGNWQPPGTCQPAPPQVPERDKEKEGAPPRPGEAQQPEPQAPVPTGAESVAAVGTSTTSLAPVIGDFSSRFANVPVNRRVTVNLQDPTRFPGVVFSAPADLHTVVRVPLASAGSFKIAENESPRPLDRVFFTYNYYNDLNTGARAAFGPSPGDVIPTLNTLTNFGVPSANVPLTGNAATTLRLFQLAAGDPRFQPLYDQYIRGVIRSHDALHVADPTIQALVNQIRKQIDPTGQLQSLPVPSSAFGIVGAGGLIAADGQTVATTGRPNLNREVFGFEKTFLDGDASIGLRVPIFQLQGDGSFSASDIGDLTLIFKYAFLNDRETGNVGSTGLVVTVPTGPDQIQFLEGSRFHPVLLQPYLGGIYNMGRFYVQGFSSIVVPTDMRDSVLWFNDMALDYRLFQRNGNAFLTGVTPTIEAHLTTPLSHRGLDHDFIGVPDTLSLTTGAHFDFCNRSRLTFAVGTPVTGPRPFDVEAIVQFNLLF
jgi:hypothetical protein